MALRDDCLNDEDDHRAGRAREGALVDLDGYRSFPRAEAASGHGRSE